MNSPDLGPAASIPANEPPTAVGPPTRQYPRSRMNRAIDPLRVTIVTAFCTCDIETPQPSYLPRLPT